MQLMRIHKDQLESSIGNSSSSSPQDFKSFSLNRDYQEQINGTGNGNTRQQYASATSNSGLNN